MKGILENGGLLDPVADDSENQASQNLQEALKRRREKMASNRLAVQVSPADVEQLIKGGTHMNLGFVSILLNLGKLIHLIKDVEHGITDLANGKPYQDDVKAVLGDIGELMKSGLINIPGLTQEQVQAILGDIQKSL